MTDRDALLAAVAAAPAADTPRLVFADWLDDHAGTTPCRWCGGEGRFPNAATPIALVRACERCGGAGHTSDGNAEWASFIRAQIGIARSRHPDPPVNYYLMQDLQRGDPDALRAVEEWRPLRDERDRVWRLWGIGAVPHPPLPGEMPSFHVRDRDRELVVHAGFGPMAEYVVRRGFVDEARLPAGAWVRDADELLASHPVRRVTLTTAPDALLEPRAGGRQAVAVLVGRSVEVVVADRLGTDEWPEHDDIRLARSLAEHLLRAEWPTVAFALPPLSHYHAAGASA